MPYSVFPPQLDRAGNVKDPSMKARLNIEYNKVKDIFDDLGFGVNAYSADELKNYIQGKLLGNAETRLDFFCFAEAFVKKIKEKQPGTANNHRIMLNNLERYRGERALPITDITANFLTKYQQWMEREGAGNGAPLGGRGQSLYLGSIRTIFNAAQSECNDYDKGDIPIPNRPFDRFKIRKAKSQKTAEDKALSVEQLRGIRDYKPRYERDGLARDCFMLSFYLCGMNSVDLFRCDKLKGGVITYYRSKVKGRRNDNAEMRVRVEPEAEALRQKYEGDATVFNFQKKYANPNNFNSNLNKGLKVVGAAVGIDDLEFYYARHSWATLAANDCRIPIDIVDEALAHVDNRMAKVYIKKDWTRIYEANRKVLDLLK